MLRWPEAPPLELDEFARAELRHARRPGARAGRARGRAVRPRRRRRDRRDPRHRHDGGVGLHGRPPARLREAGVVFTGAQRGADEPDTDGPRNLRTAIQVALADESAGRGALVVFAGEIRRARGAKVHTSALEAFGSPGTGRSATSTGSMWPTGGPTAAPPLPLPDGPLPQVDLIRLYAGATTASCEARSSRAAERSCSKRRAAATRTSACSPASRPVAAGVPVVVRSRCFEGRVEPVYGRGGGKDLAEAGAYFAGDLAGPEGTCPPPARARRRPGPLADPCCGGRMIVRVEVRQKEVSPCPY